MNAGRYHPDPIDVARQDVPRWKRGLDLCVAIPFCIFMPAVFVVMWFVTRLTSPGPVIFRQERIGLRGRRFSCLKFRTMHVGCNSDIHARHVEQLFTADVPMVKMDSCGDERLIVFGGFLRSSGLDELPQLINVLRGEMSIVGPRPCMPYELENYPDAFRERFNTLPGLTGLWQVSGKNKTTFREMLQLDIAYARKKTLVTDLWIILRTPWVLLTQVIETRPVSTSKPLVSPPSRGTAAVPPARL
ncbi:MAG TPA: sugar transferase [Opitutaceae bacterium]